MTIPPRFLSAIRVACLHFLFSLVVALLAAALVFGLWYPFPYGHLSGGRELFLLVVAVDVVCGPLLTMVLFNPAKPRAELWPERLVITTSTGCGRGRCLRFERDRFNPMRVNTA